MGTHPIFESDFDCLTENVESFGPSSYPSYSQAWLLLCRPRNRSVALDLDEDDWQARYRVLGARCLLLLGKLHDVVPDRLRHHHQKVEVTTPPEGSKGYDSSSRGIDWKNPTGQRTFNHVKDAYWGNAAWKDELKELLQEIH